MEEISIILDETDPEKPIFSHIEDEHGNHVIVGEKIQDFSRPEIKILTIEAKGFVLYDGNGFNVDNRVVKLGEMHDDLDSLLDTVETLRNSIKNKELDGYKKVDF